MGAAFAGWMKPITLIRITQSITDGLVTDNEASITFQGTIQPLSPRMIALKPEGQRAWEWLQIHAFAGSLNLDDNDRISYNDKRFKVMATNDYSLNNYIEYHVVRDYENG